MTVSVVFAGPAFAEDQNEIAPKLRALAATLRSLANRVQEEQRRYKEDCEETDRKRAKLKDL